jgi:hypothetical protein
MTMPEMTDEEADYWDAYFTANPPKLGPNGADFLSLREVSLLTALANPAMYRIKVPKREKWMALIPAAWEALRKAGRVRCFYRQGGVL